MPPLRLPVPLQREILDDDAVAIGEHVAMGILDLWGLLGLGLLIPFMAAGEAFPTLGEFVEHSVISHIGQAGLLIEGHDNIERQRSSIALATPALGASRFLHEFGLLPEILQPGGDQC